MKQLTSTIDDFLYDFYRKIGNSVGKTPEKPSRTRFSVWPGNCLWRRSAKKTEQYDEAAAPCVKKRAVRLSFFFSIYALYGLYAAYVPRSALPLGIRMVSRISLSVSRRPRSALTPLCRIS